MGTENGMEGLRFEKIYGSFPGVKIGEKAREVFDYSMARYKSAFAE